VKGTGKHALNKDYMRLQSPSVAVGSSRNLVVLKWTSGKQGIHLAFWW